MHAQLCSVHNFCPLFWQCLGENLGSHGHCWAVLYLSSLFLQLSCLLRIRWRVTNPGGEVLPGAWAQWLKVLLPGRQALACFSWGIPALLRCWQLLPGPGEKVQLPDQSVVKQKVWMNWCCMKWMQIAEELEEEESPWPWGADRQILVQCCSGAADLLISVLSFQKGCKCRLWA